MSPTSKTTYSTPWPTSPRPTTSTEDNSAATNDSTPVILRPPPSSQLQQSPQPSSQAKSFHLPDPSWFHGTWHVTHSTLPLWRDKRNVRITYTPLSEGRLDDLVTYQGLGDDKGERGDGNGPSDGIGRSDDVATEPAAGAAAGAAVADGPGEQWVITYFAKTMFTPAGIDVYARKAEGLSEATLRRLQRALLALSVEVGKESEGTAEGTAKRKEWEKLAGEMFEVVRDGAGSGVVS
ncbi:hypothetical protein MRB53_039299 [Persea americana]|nr:hypothetical protein MRB53_039299 [Persea americana]